MREGIRPATRPAQCPRAFSEALLPIIFPPDVVLHKSAISARVFHKSRGFCAVLRIASGGDDFRTLACKSQAGRTADAFRGAGDDDRAAGEFSRHCTVHPPSTTSWMPVTNFPRSLA